jgi:hypothetical protein
LATRKFSLSHLIAVVRTGNGELVEDVVHRHAIEEDGGTAHGTVVDAGPTRPTRTRGRCLVPEETERRSDRLCGSWSGGGHGHERDGVNSSPNANAMALEVMLSYRGRSS